MDININALREYLINYYGTATGMFPMAFMDVARVEKASPDELIKIAKSIRLDLSRFQA